MINFEDICREVFRGKYWKQRLSIGCLLSLMPILNIFALGYLYQYGLQIRKTNNYLLSPWCNWNGLFVDGLRMIIVLMIYIGSLISASIALSLIATLLSFGLLRIISPLLISFSIFISPIWVTSALYRFQEDEKLSSLFDIKKMIYYIQITWPKWWITSVIFTSLIIISKPIYGSAFFFGFIIIIAHSNMLYRYYDYRK